jgi:V/A-type H+-transporting ATPase subunit I
MISGLLGDLLSYIRLFVLGLTGGILGGVFNNLAVLTGDGMDIPVVSQLITLVILLFGHGLNFALNILGAVVHPLRLTYVEFYKNAGFDGGGYPFKLFEKIK